MADDGIKKSQDLKRAANEATASTNQLSDAVKANIDALNSWDLETGQSINQQNALIGTLRDSIQEIKNSAKEIGSLRGQFRDITGAVSGFAQQLKRSISLSNTYNTLLSEMRKGQEVYSRSLEASTAKIGKASAESQRHIDALHEAYYDAKIRAAEYGLEVDQLVQHTDELHAAFATQLSAMGNQAHELRGLQKETFLFSRFMGTSYQQTLQLIDSRLQGSTKTLEGVRKELMVVAREADKWTRKLQTMGKEALKTGNVTREGYLRILQEIQGEFRGGMFAAEGFAKSTGKMLEAAKKAGFTPQEAEAMASGFGKFIKQLGSAQSYWGLRVAQQFGGMLKNIEEIQDESLKKRLEPYAKKVLAGNQLNIVDLQAIVGASQGSAEGIRMLLETFRTSGMSPDVMRTILGEAMGPGQQHIADQMAKFIQSGQAEKAFALIDKNDKEAQAQRDKQMDFWKKDLEQLMKEGHTSTKIQYQTAKDIHALKTKTIAFMEKYPLMMAAIMGGAQLAGGLLGKGLGLLGAKMGLGAAGAGAAGGAGGIGAAGAGAAGAGAGTALLGVGVAAAGGYAAGRWLDKYIGGKLATGEGSIQLGKDKTLSNWASLLAYSDETRKEITRIRGGITDAHRKEYEQLKKQTKWARANWHKLDDSTKENIKAAESRMKDLGKKIQAYTLSPEDEKQYAKERVELQTKQLTDAWNRIQKETRKDDFDNASKTQNYIRDLIKMGGRSMMVGDPSKAIGALEKSGAISTIAKKSQLSEAIVRKMVLRAMAEMRFGGYQYYDVKDPKERALLMAQSMKEWLGKKGKSGALGLAATAREYIEDVKQGRFGAGGLKIKVESMPTAGDRTPTKDASGNVMIPVTTEGWAKVTPEGAAMMARSSFNRMPKFR